jgi:hypothetical protein
MELDHGGNPADWFLMAAIDHHLGNDQDARRWYDRGVAWLRQYPAVDPAGAELRRSREEAVRALGIPISTVDPSPTSVIEAVNRRTSHVQFFADLSAEASKNPRWP